MFRYDRCVEKREERIRGDCAVGQNKCKDFLPSWLGGICIIFEWVCIVWNWFVFFVCIAWETAQIVLIPVLILVTIDLINTRFTEDKCHLVERIILPNTCRGTCDPERYVCTSTSRSSYLIFLEEASSCNCFGIEIVEPYEIPETSSVTPSVTDE